MVDQLSQALGPVSEGTWVRPGVPGDRTRVRRPVGSTICPGRYWPGSKGPRGPPAGPRDSGPVLMARGVNQQSLAPGARVRNPSVLTSCPGRLETVPEGLGVEQLCQGLTRASDGPRGGPAGPGDSGPGPRARGFDHLYWATRAGARGPAVSTNSPARLGSGPRSHGRPAVPGASGPCQMSRCMDQLPRATWALVAGPAVSNRRPGRLGPCPNARGDDQLRVTRARVRGPTGSTR